MIVIDVAGPEPLEEQIYRELCRAIAAGVFPGERLPSARQLGGDLGVHWNTVARACRGLADASLVVVGQAVVVREPAGDGEALKPKVSALLRQAVTEAGRTRLLLSSVG